MGLQLLNGSENEPVALDLCKLYLKVDGTHEDVLIEKIISAARQTIEAFTGRCLLRQEWRATLNAGYAFERSDVLYLSQEKTRSQKGIELPKTPFIELLGAPTLIDDYGQHPIQDYRVDTAAGHAKIHLFSKDLAQYSPHGTLQIDFAAGYGTDPKLVPEPLKQAILMMAAQLYENRIGINDNLSLPMGESILSLIRPYQMMRL